MGYSMIRYNMIELIKQYITERFDVQAVQCEIDTVPENCLYMYGLLLIPNTIRGQNDC